MSDENTKISFSNISNPLLRRSLVVSTFPLVLAGNYLYLFGQIICFTIKACLEAPFNLYKSAKSIW